MMFPILHNKPNKKMKRVHHVVDMVP